MVFTDFDGDLRHNCSDNIRTTANDRFPAGAILRHPYQHRSSSPTHSCKGADGKWYLVYHLFLTNLGFSDLTLKSVEVTDAARRNVLTRYDDKELAEYYRFRTLLPTPPRAEMPNRQYPRQISSGRTGVLFFWLTVDAPDAIPAGLRHRFVFEPNPLINLLRGFASDRAGGEMILDDWTVSVSKETPVVIGAPLRGGDWRCSNGPAYNSIHQVLTIRGGNVRIAQRYACDFQKVDKESNILPNPFPDEITNKMFYGYGAEVLAVASGKVVFVKDGIRKMFRKRGRNKTGPCR